jgi:hypothetical protein
MQVTLRQPRPAATLPFVVAAKRRSANSSRLLRRKRHYHLRSQ